MRKTVFIIAALFCSLLAVAQNNAQDLIDMLGSSRVSIRYSYSDSKGNELGNGMATVQGHCYSVVESGTKFLCDSVTLWTVDNHKKEIYIENAGGKSDLFGNLDAILKGVSNLVIEGTRVSFTMTLQGVPEPISCKATILRKTNIDEDLKDFRVDVSKYDKLWIVTDLR